MTRRPIARGLCSASDDWHLLVDSPDGPPLTLEQRSARIAAHLRSGQASAFFLKMLAGMIDPEPTNVTPFVLKLGRKRGGRPAAERRLGVFMARLVDEKAVPLKQAVYQAQSKYGVGRSTCLAALKAEREWRETARTHDELVKKYAHLDRACESE